MANQIYIPYLNPCHYVEMDPVLIPQYVSKHMDDYLFASTIRPHQQTVPYLHKWSVNDAIREQIKTNYGPVVLKMKRCDGSEVYSQNFTTRQEDADRPGTFLRQTDLDLATFAPGFYYREIHIGSNPAKVLVCDPFEIATSVPSTLYLEYSHFEKYQGTYFQSPFNPTLRVPAVIDYNDTASKDTIYEDEPLSETMLKSTPYRLYDFKLGGSRGVPPWLADKVKRIFGCSDLRADGRYYTKSEGAKWERTERDNYPMHGWQIQLRDAQNKEEMIYENDAQVIGIAAAGLIVSTKHFGISDTGSDYLEIISAR
jgi:hypothetical protein